MPATPTFGLGAVRSCSRPLGDAHDPTAWVTSDDSWRVLNPARGRAAGRGIRATPPEVCDGRSVPARWQDVRFADDD
jgi:hypothetical protein